MEQGRDLPRGKGRDNQWRRRRRDGRSDGCANDGKGERRLIGARRGTRHAARGRCGKHGKRQQEALP